MEQGTERGTHATTRKIARVAEDSGDTLTLGTLSGRAAALGKFWVADSLLTPVSEVTWTLMAVAVSDRGVRVLFVAGVRPAGGVGDLDRLQGIGCFNIIN